MTQEGFKNWFDRAIGFADNARKDAPEDLNGVLIFSLKSGKEIRTTIGTFFEWQDCVPGCGNITVYPEKSQGENVPIHEIDIESIEAIGW